MNEKTEKTLSPSEQFDKEIADLTKRRGSVYGHPSTDFGRVARIKAALADCSDPKVRHVLEMIAVKMSRLVESPRHLDSWVDIAGYARTGTMLMDSADDEALNFWWRTSMPFFSEPPVPPPPPKFSQGQVYQFERRHGESIKDAADRFVREQSAKGGF